MEARNSLLAFEAESASALARRRAVSLSTRAGDVGQNRDERLEGPVGVLDRLDLQMEVIFAAGLGVVDDIGADALAAGHSGAHADDGAGIGFRADHEVGGVFAEHVVQGVFHDAAEGVVDPLDAAVGRADDDRVIGLRGDEGEFAGLGLAGARACSDSRRAVIS